MEITIGSLFSGIGGFELGLEIAGFGPVKWQVEIDDYCCKILEKHWPEAKRFRDIREVGKQNLERVELICGGFPCQPFSVAGGQLGQNDNRYLWPEMFRVVRELGPRFVLAENVPGIKKMALDQVLADLESEDYATTTLVIPACAVNAPHRRDRVWIIGHSNTTGCNRIEGKERAFQNDNSNLYRGNSHVADTESGEAYTAKPNGFYAESCGKDTDVTDSTGEGLPGVRQSELREQLFYAQRRSWEEPWPEIAARLCGMDARVPRELDFIRGLNDYYSSKKSQSEIRNIEWKILRNMWEYRELAKTSPDLFAQKLQNCVPEMPYKNSHGRWYLGQGIEKNEPLCNLWERFYAEGQSSTQNMQCELLESIGKVKCEKTVDNRVNRLKCLGNTVVPQIVQAIGEILMRWIENNATIEVWL